MIMAMATPHMAMRHTHGAGVAGAIVPPSSSAIRGKDITAKAIIRSSTTVAAALGMWAAVAEATAVVAAVAAAAAIVEPPDASVRTIVGRH